jgi:hypothetical protein
MFLVLGQAAIVLFALSLLPDFRGMSVSAMAMFQQLSTESHVRDVTDQGGNATSSASHNQSQNR